MTAILEAQAISVSFGGVRACDAIDIAVHGDQVVGLTGPNGSGKSTLLNAIGGLVEATGTLAIDGRPVELGDLRAVRRCGVLRTFQAPQNLDELSCIENVMLSTTERSSSGLFAAVLGRSSMWARERRRIDEAQSALERVGLGGEARTLAGQLTYGHQRLLELARAIAGRPTLLMLDEPSAGLNAAETNELAALLESLHAEGMPMIVIDHKVDFLDRLSDRIVVLQLGRVIAEGVPEEIWNDPSVVDAYLGARRDG